MTSCTDLPIYALTPGKSTLGRVALYRSVHPIEFVSDSQDYTTVIRQAVSQLIERKLLSPEDSVLVTKGVLHCRGGTNSLEILKVADVVANRNDGYPGHGVAV